MSNHTGFIIPAIRHRIAHEAIEWFCELLGFDKKLVVPMGEQGMAYAQFTLGGGMITVSSYSVTDYSKLII